MAEGKLEVIMTRLLAKSREGEVDWEEGPRLHQFVTAVGDNSIIISREWEEEQEYLRILILNDSGQEVENSVWQDARTEELFQLARRTALKTEDTLDDILRDLG